MLGSHDSYTYLDAKSQVLNSTSRFWRCQNKTITQQYKAGVRYFDIRVFRDKDGDREVWRVAHGLAELSKVFANLKAICVYVKGTLKGSKMRLFLEKGDEVAKALFKKELDQCKDVYECVDWAGYKYPWTTLYRRKDSPAFNDLTFEDWTFKNIVSNLFKFPIKNNAAKNNPVITQEMIDDPKTCWFMDYVTGLTATEVKDAAKTQETSQEEIAAIKEAGLMPE